MEYCIDTKKCKAEQMYQSGNMTNVYYILLSEQC